jgi:O-antigen ligase/tetratricopeptide (TPR) repeat protein
MTLIKKPFQNSTILSGVIAFAGLCLAFVAGGYIWRGSFAVQLFGYLAVGLGATAYLVWRGVFRRTKLPSSGLEWVFGVCALALGLSLVFSPDLRQGGWRVGELLGYLLLFYFFLDAFRAGWNRRSVVIAILGSSGILLVMAVLETYVQYTSWWQVLRFPEMPPYIYRFVGLIGHPNALMGIVNLCAPLAVIALLRAGKRLERVACGVWIAFYLLSIPFSSSRGGWLGLLVWGGTFLLLWGYEQRVWQKLRRWRARLWLWVGLAAVVLLPVLGYVGYRGFVLFATNPSHGADIFGGRLGFWIWAGQVWQSFPWTGAGPGRFAFEVVKVTQTIPPGFWPLHPHGLPAEVLAESGLVGSAAFLLLVGMGFYKLWRSYQVQAGRDQVWKRAILAGLVGWFLQMIVDDQTMVFGEMVLVILLVAMLLTFSEKEAVVSHPISLNLLWLPLAGWLALTGGSLWGYQPMALGLQAAQQNNWPVAASLIQQSAQRDPALSFYSTETGFAWARVWQGSSNKIALQTARHAFEQSLRIEPSLSYLWANLAVLDWQAGDRAAAIQHMQAAARLSPQEPTYQLNLGWFQENSQAPQAAQAAYLDALRLAPFWADHPFWQATPLRQAFLANWKKSQPAQPVQSQAYWQRAMQAVQSEDWAGAQRWLAYAGWVGEPSADIAWVSGQMAEAQGDPRAALAIYQKEAEKISFLSFGGGNTNSLTYSLWLNNRNGLGFDLVPGYLQLSGSNGQFTILDRLQVLARQQGDCPAANKAWQIEQQAILGGSLEPLPAPPACP